ncbi:MAG TPA: serine/threonine-protein kinase, partial [Polyangiaceae bacterium]|nr:serine/threonine-protein kinase [Polyangiaceae bacterium]
PSTEKAPTDADEATDPTIGSVLAERYLIRALIGEGGMGKVYAGEHVLMRKRVAIKILHRELTTIADVVQRFEREAMAAANIDHPNVAAATDFGHLPDGSVFLVLEYVQGISLRSEIASGPLETVRALHIARQIASGISSAHARGIVHRDLKPENVMLVERAGDPDFVKVLDFGIAKVRIRQLSDRESVRPGEIITKVGMIFGTPEYMAPEQALGEDADGRADQFSLGVILFEMLAGRRPYRSLNQVGILGQQLKGPPPKLAEIAPSVSAAEEIDQILAKMLATDREQRFASAQEVVEALEAVLLVLQPALLIRGSRPDASLGPGALLEPPISSRSAPHSAGSAAQSSPRLGGPVQNSSRLLTRPKSSLFAIPVQLLLALGIGVGIGAIGGMISLVVRAVHRQPEVKVVPSATSEPTSAGELVVVSSERAPETDVAFARANGTAAFEALIAKYPADASVLIEMAKLQFADSEFYASVGSIARALVVSPKIANYGEVATLLWKAVQKRESADAVFELLEGAMGTRGSDILYDLVSTPELRKDIRTRAEEYFTSGRYRGRSTPALVTLI